MIRILPVLISFLCFNAHADPGLDTAPSVDVLPLFELGFGIGSSHHPHYPGSDQSQTDTLPFPYGVYRGKFLYADRRGNARARLLRNEIVELSLSGAGGFPVKSVNNNARRGMADLDWMGQFGPRLLIRLGEGTKGQTLRLGLPFRAVVTSADFKTFIHRGYVYEPELIFSYPRFYSDNLNLFMLATIAVADENFMQYVYGVSSGDATPTRSVFDPRKGIFTSSLTVGVSADLFNNRLRVMTVGTLTNLNGAANEESPLMRSRTNFSLSFVVIPILYRSESLVAAED